jgi:hypothetical protein
MSLIDMAMPDDAKAEIKVGLEKCIDEEGTYICVYKSKKFREKLLDARIS